MSAVEDRGRRAGREPGTLSGMNEEKRKTLYLIDGPNMAFRAVFAIGGM